MSAGPTPYATAAHNYLRAGWWPIPVEDAGGKSGIPRGFTGTHGRPVSHSDVVSWVITKPAANIALRMPLDVIGVDVDAYGDKPGAETLAELEERLGALPPTWVATARPLPSGKRLYRVPNGTRLRSTMGPGIDVCQFHHRYVVVAPSVHHTGADVIWVDSDSGELHDSVPTPDDLPELPWAWLEEFSTSGSAEVALAATDQAVDDWIERNQAELRPKWFDATMTRLREQLDAGNARHDSFCAALCSVVREAEAGAFSAAAVIPPLIELWEHVTRGEGREAEFADMLAWAVGQLHTERSKAEIAEKRERLTTPRQDGIVLVGDGTRPDELPLLLPDWVWSTRPSLAHIRTAAISRMTPPDAVLHACLARVAALSSHTLELPPNVGGAMGLSYMTMLVGRAGNGKSTSMATARDLIPVPAGSNVADGLPLGSGEGLAEVLFDTVTEPDPDSGKPTKVRRQVRHQAVVTVDEGTLLAELGQRKGTTVLSTLRTIYTHGTIGNTNASTERRRIVHGDRYVYGVVVGIQPALAGPLLDVAEIAAGTPQRFSWVWCVDPRLTPELSRWPGTLDWEPPTPGELSQLERIISHGAAVRHRIPVPDCISLEVRNEIHRARTTDDVDELDAHLMLQRLKVAALLGILDGRLEVTVDDWQLAGIVVATSCAVRSHVVQVLRQTEARSEMGATEKLIRREAASEDAASSRALASAAGSVARKVAREGRCTRRTLTQAIASKHRALVSVDDVLARAVGDGLIRLDGDEYVPGRRSA